MACGTVWVSCSKPRWELFRDLVGAPGTVVLVLAVVRRAVHLFFLFFCMTLCSDVGHQYCGSGLDLRSTFRSSDADVPGAGKAGDVVARYGCRSALNSRDRLRRRKSDF